MRRRTQVLAILLTLAALALPTQVPAGQWGYPPMGGWSFGPPQSHLRFQVTPSDAEIYLDGYYAGRVDDFDGTFQRLHVPPGQHEIVIYREGYRSLRQHLYLSVNSTRTVEGELLKLAPGEPDERRPEPPPDMDRGEEEEPPQTPPPSPERRAPRRPADAAPPPRPPASGERPTLATLLIDVRPTGSSITIDGQLWEGPRGRERLIVQVPEGHHRVEISRKRYETRTIDVDVRAGETRPLSVTLERQ